VEGLTARTHSRAGWFGGAGGEAAQQVAGEWQHGHGQLMVRTHSRQRASGTIVGIQHEKDQVADVLRSIHEQIRPRKLMYGWIWTCNLKID
jgi:hypothetical protein